MARRALSQEIVEQQREDAIRIAHDLFLQQGPDAVSVRAIADAVSMSAMALYRYFPRGKGELLATVRGRGFDRLKEALSRSITGKEHPIDQILAAVQALLAFALRQPGLYRLMFEVTQPQDHNDPYLAGRRKEAWERARAPFDAAWSAGLLRGDKDTLAHIFFAAIHGVISFEISGQPSPQRRLNQLIGPTLEVLFAGLGAQPATMRKVSRAFGRGKSRATHPKGEVQ